MNPQGNEWNLFQKEYEDRIAGKGFTSMSHNKLTHKFVLMLLAMKIQDAKSCSDKEWKKSRRFQPGSWIKSKARRRLIPKHTETKGKSILLH